MGDPSPKIISIEYTTTTQWEINNPHQPSKT